MSSEGSPLSVLYSFAAVENISAFSSQCRLINVLVCLAAYR